LFSDSAGIAVAQNEQNGRTQLSIETGDRSSPNGSASAFAGFNLATGQLRATGECGADRLISKLSRFLRYAAFRPPPSMPTAEVPLRLEADADHQRGGDGFFSNSLPGLDFGDLTAAGNEFGPSLLAIQRTVTDGEEIVVQASLLLPDRKGS
jgi:hypothetical protein